MGATTTTGIVTRRCAPASGVHPIPAPSAALLWPLVRLGPGQACSITHS